MKTKPVIPTAESIMNRHVHSVTPATSLSDIVRSLLKHEISCTPVVSGDGAKSKTLVGFVTEGDCLEHLSNEMFYGNPRPPQTAETIMTRHPICVDQETDIFALASVLANHHLRHVPVVDAEHQLLGLVSRREVLRALEHFYDQLDQDYKSEHFPPDLHQIINMRFVAGRG